MISQNYTISTTTATKILDSQNFEQHIYIHNNHSNKMYLGGSDVTSTNGLHLDNGQLIELRIPQDNELYAISEGTTGDLVVLRPR
jgi:hypothetical protein